MLDQLITIDKLIFYFFNGVIANSFFDIIMPIITNENIWALPVILGLIYLLLKGGRRGQITIIILIISCGLADYSSASILKPFFERLRPSHEMLDGIRILMGKGGKYGFVSSHAANYFGVLTLMWQLLSTKWVKYLLVMLVLLVLYSRMYLGVHYLSDVSCGALLGYVLAKVVIQFLLLKKVKQT